MPFPDLCLLVPFLYFIYYKTFCANGDVFVITQTCPFREKIMAEKITFFTRKILIFFLFLLKT